MSKSINILLVDDDPDDQHMLEEYLFRQNRHIAVRRAANGKEAVDLLNTDKSLVPDLMILDYKMPLMGAVEILKHFNEKQTFQSTPKVVWSTSDQHSHRQICINNGAVKYFVKPGSPAGLTKLATDLLKLIS